MNLIHNPTEARLLKVREALADAIAAAYGEGAPADLLNRLAFISCTAMDAHMHRVTVPGGESG